VRRATHAWAPRTAAVVLLVALVAVIAPASAGAQGAPHTGHSMAWGRETFVLLDRLELPLGRDSDASAVALRGWHGGADRRLWVGAELAGREYDDLALDVALGRLVAPYWDLLAGAWLETSLDGAFDSRRGLGGMIGVHGLAPGWFEVEASARVSAAGDVGAKMHGAYDLYLTQRLVLDPSVGFAWHARPIRERAIAAGVSEIEGGVRLRYELSRRFAPYVGARWERRRIDGGTAPVASAEERAFVTGLRAWF
jgi:copper resistance protein B